MVTLWAEENLPTTPRRESRQWLTGFFTTLSLSDFPGTFKAAPEVTGCHGGIVTKMLSVGSHSLYGVLSAETCAGLVASTEVPVGSWGIKVPSSRSLSYTMIVPSACETRNSVDDRGTHRTAVHGDPEIEPLLMISFLRKALRTRHLTCLLRRPYRELIGSGRRIK
jgi:hypothetical protein